MCVQCCKFKTFCLCPFRRLPAVRVRSPQQAFMRDEALPRYLNTLCSGCSRTFLNNRVQNESLLYFRWTSVNLSLCYSTLAILVWCTKFLKSRVLNVQVSLSSLPVSVPQSRRWTRCSNWRYSMTTHSCRASGPPGVCNMMIS